MWSPDPLVADVSEDKLSEISRHVLRSKDFRIRDLADFFPETDFRTPSERTLPVFPTQSFQDWIGEKKRQRGKSKRDECAKEIHDGIHSTEKDVPHIQDSPGPRSVTLSLNASPTEVTIVEQNNELCDIPPTPFDKSQLCSNSSSHICNSTILQTQSEACPGKDKNENPDPLESSFSTNVNRVISYHDSAAKWPKFTFNPELSFPPYALGQIVEFKSFIPGYRGAWFVSTIKGCDSSLYPKSEFFVKKYLMRYLDYSDEDEWIWMYEDVATKLQGCSERKKSKAMSATDNKLKYTNPFELMVRPKPPRQIKMNQYDFLMHQSWEILNKREKGTNLGTEYETSDCLEKVIVVRNEWKIGDWVDWYCKGSYWTCQIILKNNTTALLRAPDPPEGEYIGTVWKAKLKNLRASIEFDNGEWSFPNIDANDPYAEIKFLPKNVLKDANRIVKRKRCEGRRKRRVVFTCIVNFLKP